MAFDRESRTISCSGKKGYTTRNEAKDSLYAERRRYPKLAFEIYRCPICGLLHVGHDRKYRNANVDMHKKKWRKHQKAKK
ncbi:MAG: hypothetical protein WC455_23980 [Dehalococcoidia bacterium]|jgi:hypothetical protein